MCIRDSICTNVQETDLAGHSQSTKTYREILETADRKLGEMLPLLTEDDILVVMADHGNDPLIGHSRHTRECVPLLVYKKMCIRDRPIPEARVEESAWWNRGPISLRWCPSMRPSIP